MSGTPVTSASDCLCRDDSEKLFADIRRNAKKMADLTTASVYHHRPGTNTFDFIRTEPEEVFDRLACEGYFDGTAQHKGC